MNVRSVSTQAESILGSIYRYGMLAIILGLLAWCTRLYFRLPPGYNGDPYGNLVGALMLLFNHLAFAFKWPRPITVVLWTLAFGWLVFGFFYISYWSCVLYPIVGPGQN